MLALVDIDGTIADIGHRLHFIRAGNNLKEPDWESFFNEMINDKPIYPVLNLVRAMAYKYKIVYLTGRPDSHRRMTLEWMGNNLAPHGMLVMRRTGDYRPDFVVKKELYESVVVPFSDKADIVIEDRGKVVEMWRGMGLTCLQPREGDY